MNTAFRVLSSRDISYTLRQALYVELHIEAETSLKQAGCLGSLQVIKEGFSVTKKTNTSETVNRKSGAWRTRSSATACTPFLHYLSRQNSCARPALLVECPLRTEHIGGVSSLLKSSDEDAYYPLELCVSSHGEMEAKPSQKRLETTLEPGKNGILWLLKSYIDSHLLDEGDFWTAQSVMWPCWPIRVAFPNCLKTANIHTLDDGLAYWY
ncbi:hypothetical protein CEK26_000471 [Fusarium fujikuroi]|nr:hypothetical protein CEK27_000469 [Fusarium fujikuroi]QGI89256.1 hypothetical protein CEK26_000471 [Fusarium fujikuroi]